jgi:glyoxylase-like metal-dependent hydrolase (beta-lactamase superfamily II)
MPKGETTVKIHAIQTGTVAVTSAWREGVGHGRRRLLHALLDREWTEPLPIYAFAIEHPEGVIVVDTGEDARAFEPSYFARWHPGSRASREQVEPEQEIGPQLKELGIQPGDVRWVDHTVFLAGDSSNTQELMLRGKPDGVGADEQAERLTHEQIRAFAAETPTVYLVAHDPEAGMRLAERRLVYPVAAEVAA